MTDFAYKPDVDAVHFEFRARQLVPKLQSLRDCLLAIKEEASDVAAQQWAKSHKDEVLADFTLVDEGIRVVEDNLAHVLFLIRELKMHGRQDTACGQTEMDT